jgi:hypothetical protein
MLEQGESLIAFLFFHALASAATALKSCVLSSVLFNTGPSNNYYIQPTAAYTAHRGP